MSSSVYEISLLNLCWIFIPVVIVITILLRWSIDIKPVLHGLARMLLQLIIMGYALGYIFAVNQPLIILIILSVMLSAAALIALRPLKNRNKTLYFKALQAIATASILTLFIVTQAVLSLTSWFEPRYLIPLAGMIFANSMNAVSLAAERFESEIVQDDDYLKARSTALQAALIPITNSLFAVGLVSLPGMMTGQILSGVSPLIAARYQIMVMCMIYGSAGIAAAHYLMLIKKVEGKGDKG
jgi:putative ABC transport system permease protein